jgi:hypothetical protein
MFNRKTINPKTTSQENEGFSPTMFRRGVIAKLSVGALFAALCALPACSIDTHDKDKNGAKRVDIQSPFGDMHVSEQADYHDTGLTLYPGATPAPKDNGDDSKSANVNMSFPGFSLKVVAAEFLSDDAPGKLIAYYSKELQKYGSPIRCDGAWAGNHVNAKPGKGDDDGSKPVTCDNGTAGKSVEVKVGDSDKKIVVQPGSSEPDSVELKVGTESNQHIVSVKPNNKGARFALVYVRTHTGKDDSI